MLLGAGVCCLVGFGAKAGMFPLHIWLPKAHPVAPAPASALLSGILTKSGVFGILVVSRYLLWADTDWNQLLLLLGTVTMVLGAVLALFSIDLKRTLACSSMSQIGFILLGVSMQGYLGAENALAAWGTVLHMLNHSLIKLLLFVAAGVIYLGNHHSLDLNEIRGWGRNKPWLKIIFFMGGASIAGVPGFSGYVSKTLLHESIVEYIHELNHLGEAATTFQVVEWLFLISGGLTAAYMTKLFVCIFVEARPAEHPLGVQDYMSRPTQISLTIGALIIISYTFLGGFFAVCWTDLIQGLLMFAALVVVPLVCIIQTPDLSAVQFLNADGAVISNYLNLFENINGDIAWTTILSGLAWGLGYFGMPHILVRFMAIKSSDLIKKSRIIATIWVFVTLAAAVLVGVFGYIFLHSEGNDAMLAEFAAFGDTEKIFMFLSGKLLPGLIAGIVLAAILAAIMSTADSQLLVTASSVSNDMFKLFKKDAKEKTLMWISRGTVIAVAVIAYFIALDPNSSVMGLVSYAWAGLGAAFGPAMLLSLFWKRMTMSGAVAGIISGGASVIIWETIPMIPVDGALVSLSTSTGIYSLLPAFIIAAAAVIIVSLCTKVDGAKVEELFARAKAKETEQQAIGE